MRPAIALPREPVAVPVETVAFQPHEPPEPYEIDSVAIDAMLYGVGIQLVSTEKARRLHLELRFLRARFDDAQQVAQGSPPRPLWKLVDATAQYGFSPNRGAGRSRKSARAPPSIIDARSMIVRAGEVRRRL
jgi:hypothetical protein